MWTIPGGPKHVDNYPARSPSLTLKSLGAQLRALKSAPTTNPVAPGEPLVERRALVCQDIDCGICRGPRCMRVLDWST